MRPLRRLSAGHHEDAAQSIRSRGAGGAGRARHLPECRERLLRHPGQGAEPPRPGHRGRACRHNIGRRVDHRIRGLGKRPHPWPAVQGPVPQDLRAHVGRRHREIPCVGHDPGHRAGLRQEAPARVRREGVRRHRDAARSPAGSRWHWPGACGSDRRGLGRAEGGPRDHGLPAQPRRRYGPGGAHFQYLWCRRHPGHDRESRIAWRATSAASVSRPPTPSQ